MSKSEYGRFRNSVTNSIRLCKKNDFIKKLDEFKCNMKETWKILNKVIQIKLLQSIYWQSCADFSPWDTSPQKNF